MIYIIETNIYNATGIGVYKKVLAQCRSFEKEFGTTYFTTWIGGIAYLLNGGTIIERGVALTKKEFYHCIENWIEQYEIKNAYIRYNIPSRWLIDLFEYLKRNGIRSIVEIHTFDYAIEFNDRMFVAEDNYYGNKLRDYYDICVGYEDRKTFRGMSVISLTNGVDLSEHPLACKKNTGEEGCVLIGVAHLGFWQGYERVIKGIHAYYEQGGQTPITFYIIGDGPEYDYYNRLIQEYHLEDYVHLTGVVYSNEELQSYYVLADIGIGSLGLYKKEADSAGTIKLREYCARGIPFLYGYEDAGFSEEAEYVMKVPNDDSIIDMEKVLEFCEFTQRKRKELALKMRRYIQENYTWDVLMQPVIEYLENDVR